MSFQQFYRDIFYNGRLWGKRFWGCKDFCCGTASCHWDKLAARLSGSTVSRSLNTTMGEMRYIVPMRITVHTFSLSSKVFKVLHLVVHTEFEQSRSVKQKKERLRGSKPCILSHLHTPGQLLLKRFIMPQTKSHSDAVNTFWFWM